MALNYDMETEFETLLNADATDIHELRLRFVIPLVFAALTWIGDGGSVFTIWALVYVALDWFYVRLLRNTPRPVTRGRFWLCIGVAACAATCASTLPILLLYLKGQDGVFIASCCVAAFALHPLTRNLRWSFSAFIGLGVVFISAASLTIFTALHTSSPLEATVAVFAGLAAHLFYIACFRQIIREREILARQTEQDAQSEKMKSLGQLTSGIAHDFNNLLTVIGGNIELAKTSTLARKDEEFLDDALNATQRAAALVSHLLAFSRKSKLKHELLNLADVLEGLRDGMLRVLPANIELSVDICESGALVSADRVMLESALLNLVINARDAINGAQGSICLSTQTRAELGVLAIHVDDTGTGMREEDLARAIEPFFTTKSIGQGSGLGLSMVNGFAEQSGGRFDLSNRAAGGMRATIYLPLGQLGRAV